MSPADRSVFARAQLILLRERDISQLFVNGLVGGNFARPLAFYLDKKREYLHELLKSCRRGKAADHALEEQHAEMVGQNIF